MAGVTVHEPNSTPLFTEEPPAFRMPSMPEIEEIDKEIEELQEYCDLVRGICNRVLRS